MSYKVLIQSCVLSCFAGLTLLLGCGTSQSPVVTPPTAATTGAAVGIYVTQAPQQSKGAVLRFSAKANGAVQPTDVLNLPSDLIFVQSVAVDASGNIYAGGRTTTLGSEIVVYAAGASGSATPLRTLIGGPESFTNPGELTFDSIGNLYVGSDDRIIIYPSPGSTVPSRQISGPLTQLTEIDGIAVDPQGVIYVTNGKAGVGSVLAFSSIAAGNVAPIRTITGVGNLPLYDPSGIATDRSGNLYVAAFLAATGPPSILEFAPGSSGFAMPLNIITSAATGLAGIGSLRVDGAGNLYAVVLTPITTGTGTSLQLSVSTFAAGAAGNVPPLSTFSSTAWTSSGFAQIGLD